MTVCDLHMSCQSGQALSPTASHSQQKSIAEGLTDDSRDTTDMTNCVQEQNQPHLSSIDLVVVIEVVIKDTIQLYQNGNK